MDKKEKIHQITLNILDKKDYDKLPLLELARNYINDYDQISDLITKRYSKNDK